MINIQKVFEEFQKNWEIERKEWTSELDKTYDPKKMALVKDFLMSAQNVKLNQVCNPTMSEFLFKNNGSDMLIRKDEPSMQRKVIHNEDGLFCSYYYEDLSSFSTTSTMNVDVLCRKKEIPAGLKRTLEDLDFFSDSLIDFETLEFPHYGNESYYGFHSESVRKLHENLSKKNKDISKTMKGKESRLYRDTEKFHVIFAAGGRKQNKLEFLPVYVGFGTNQPYGLVFNGKLGKSRFMKWSFDSEESGLEKGSLKETPITPQEFQLRFNKMSLAEVFWGEDYITYSIQDENYPEDQNIYGNVIFDESRFKGFIKIKGKKQNSQAMLVEPRFLFKPINQREYLQAALGRQELNVPVIRSTQDIFNVLEENLLKYEEFSSLMYDPDHVVRKFGLEEVFKAVSSKLNGGEFNFVDALNVASDAYMIGTDSHERLKLSSMIIGNYINSGKLEELLEATYVGNKINPL